MSTIDSSYTTARREHTLDVEYGAFTHGFESLLGTMDVGFLREMAAHPRDELRARLASFAGASGFALFQKIDHGTLLSLLGGRAARAMTYVFGNGLIAVEMTKREPRVGLYVPLRLFVIEAGPGRISVTYEVPSKALAQFGSPEINEVAASLDGKVEQLIADAARLAVRDARASA